jgi:hypothetical protein
MMLSACGSDAEAEKLQSAGLSKFWKYSVIAPMLASRI